jgi:hypothetical protein
VSQVRELAACPRLHFDVLVTGFDLQGGVVMGNGRDYLGNPREFDRWLKANANVGTEATIPMGLRILAIVLRALFIGALVAVTVRVSSPQSESLASVYETPADLIRLALGFAVCLWIVIHLFMLPRTADGYRTWVYLGLVVAPLAWAVAIVIW